MLVRHLRCIAGDDLKIQAQLPQQFGPAQRHRSQDEWREFHTALDELIPSALFVEPGL
jgi:hypothetical protein